MILRINLGEETSDTIGTNDRTPVYLIKRLRRSEGVSLFVVAMDDSGNITDRQEVTETGRFLFFNVVPEKLRLEISNMENGVPRDLSVKDADLFVELEAGEK